MATTIPTVKNPAMSFGTISIVTLASIALRASLRASNVARAANIASSFEKSIEINNLRTTLMDERRKLLDMLEKLGLPTTMPTDYSSVHQSLPIIGEFAALKLTEELNHWMEASVKVLVKYGFGPGDDYSADIPARGSLNGAERSREYLEELKKVTAGLQKFNKQLAAMLPPGYGVLCQGSSEDNSITRAHSAAEDETDSSTLVSQFAPSLWTSTSTITNCSTSLKSLSGRVEYGPQGSFLEQGCSEKAVEEEKRLTATNQASMYAQPIQHLYDSCLRAVQAVRERVTEKEMEPLVCAKAFGRSALRFAQWGVGLFEHPVRLDSVLETSKRDEFRSHIISTLADYAIVLGIVMDSLQDRARCLEEPLNNILTCFGKYNEIADEASFGPDFLYDDELRRQDPTTYYNQCAEVLGDLTDCLYDILPMIRLLRENFQFDLQSLQSPAAVRSTVPTKIQLKSASKGVKQNQDLVGIGSGVDREPVTIHAQLKYTSQVVTIDLEMACAIYLSKREQQTTGGQETGRCQEQLEDIGKWENEIKRLKNWSKAYEKNADKPYVPGAEETKREVFKTLASLSAKLASALPMDMEKDSKTGQLVKEELKRILEAEEDASAASINVTIDDHRQGEIDPLKDFQDTNDALYELAPPPYEVDYKSKFMNEPSEGGWPRLVIEPAQ